LICVGWVFLPVFSAPALSEVTARVRYFPSSILDRPA
jgi:hypothetical protein